MVEMCDRMKIQLEQKTDQIKELTEQLDAKTIDFHKLESQIEDLNGRLMDRSQGLIINNLFKILISISSMGYLCKSF